MCNITIVQKAAPEVLYVSDMVPKTVLRIQQGYIQRSV